MNKLIVLLAIAALTSACHRTHTTDHATSYPGPATTGSQGAPGSQDTKAVGSGTDRDVPAGDEQIQAPDTDEDMDVKEDIDTEDDINNDVDANEDVDVDVDSAPD